MKIQAIVFSSIFLFWGSNDDKYPLNIQQVNCYEDESVLRNEYYYSIQILQISLNNIDENLRIYNSLKKKYLVYYYNGPNEENYRIRESKINVGCFDSKIVAERYINTFKSSEGYNSKVDSIKLFIDSYKNEFDIITTPSTIWKRHNEYTVEIFLFDSTKVQTSSMGQYSKAVISPDGNDVVFYFNKKITKLNLKTLEASTLVKNSDVHFWGLSNSQPRWSYNGEYIAFLDDFNWESRTSLWIIESDGSNLSCIVDNTRKNDQQAVKSFLWHPFQLGIFFIEGFAYGTITLGGNIYTVDIKGNRKNVVTANKSKREEIYNYFTLEEDHLIYDVVQFDDEFMTHERTKQKIKLPDI